MRTVVSVAVLVVCAHMSALADAKKPDGVAPQTDQEQQTSSDQKQTKTAPPENSGQADKRTLLN